MPGLLEGYKERLRGMLDAKQTTAYRPQADQGLAPAQPQQAAPGLGDMAGGLEQPAPEQSQLPTPSPQGAPGGLEATGKTGKQAPELEFDESKLQGAKTPAEVIAAAKPNSLGKYMNYYNREVADINQAYDNMRNQLGMRPDGRKKLSRQEKFAALMEFGINLIKASQGRGDDTAGTFAVATGATVEGLAAKDKQRGLDYDAKAATIEKGRSDALKRAGTYGDALKAQSGLDRDQATIDEMAGRDDNIAGTVETDTGLYGRTRKGLVSLEDPTTKKTAKRPPDKAGSSSRSEYEKRHEDLVSKYKRKGLSAAEAEDQATTELNDRTRNGSFKSGKERAREETNKDLAGTNEWKRANSETRKKLRGKAMDKARLDAIYSKYGIDYQDMRANSSLSDIAGMSGKGKKQYPEPTREELQILKEDPSKAQDFYEDFGYLPDDFWPE